MKLKKRLPGPKKRARDLVEEFGYVPDPYILMHERQFSACAFSSYRTLLDLTVHGIGAGCAQSLCSLCGDLCCHRLGRPTMRST